MGVKLILDVSSVFCLAVNAYWFGGGDRSWLVYAGGIGALLVCIKTCMETNCKRGQRP